MIVYICSVKLSCQYTCFYTKNELIFATLNRGAFLLLSKNEREMAYLHSKMHIVTPLPFLYSAVGMGI